MGGRMGGRMGGKMVGEEYNIPREDQSEAKLRVYLNGGG